MFLVFHLFWPGVLVQILLNWVSLSLEGGGDGDCFGCLFSDFFSLCGTGGVLGGGRGIGPLLFLRVQLAWILLVRSRWFLLLPYADKLFLLQLEFLHALKGNPGALKRPGFPWG